MANTPVWNAFLGGFHPTQGGLVSFTAKTSILSMPQPEITNGSVDAKALFGKWDTWAGHSLNENAILAIPSISGKSSREEYLNFGAKMGTMVVVGSTDIFGELVYISPLGKMVASGLDSTNASPEWKALVSSEFFGRIAQIIGEVPASTGACVVVCLDNSANTNYDLSFDSIIKHGKYLVGADSNGIWILDSTRDDGAAIPATLTIPQDDFGASNLKQVTDCYVDSEGGQFSVLVNESRVSIGKDSTDIRTKRIKIGRGLRKSRFYRTIISNVDGSQLHLDQVELRAYILDRKANNNL